MVTALARLHTGILAPVQVRDFLAGAPHSAQAPEQITLQGFQMVAAKIYTQDINNPQRLADVLAPVMAGKVDVDAAAKLPILYAEHVRKQPLHATVPLITADEVLSLQQRPQISELIAIDCRTAEEFDVRPLLYVLLLNSAAMVQKTHDLLLFTLIPPLLIDFGFGTGQNVYHKAGVAGIKHTRCSSLQHAGGPQQ